MQTLPTVKRGDTWIFSFLWKNNNTPIDLSDCTAKMQIRRKKTRSLLIEADSNSGVIIEGTLGKVTITFSADLTTTVEPGQHETDLQVTFTSTGEVRSSQTLSLTVEEDITR